MKTKACRVTYQGTRYAVDSNGLVRFVVAASHRPGCTRTTGIGDPMCEGCRTVWVNHMVVGVEGDFVDVDLARQVRREAARQRRNRNARERHEAMTDLGLKRVRGGLGGVYYE